MTVEELLLKVNEKADTTVFKSLSKKTIDEELNDVLDEIGDNEVVNDKVITKLANRLKRMDGNLHKNVSDEIKKAKEDAERRKKAAGNKQEPKSEGEKKVQDVDDKYAALEEKLNKLLADNAERDREAARKSVLQSVRSGLKDKFDKARLELNDFFLETALSKLRIPDKEANVPDLISEAEGIYTSDYKRANGVDAIPKRGGNRFRGDDKSDEKIFEEIVERRKKRFGDATK